MPLFTPHNNTPKQCDHQETTVNKSRVMEWVFRKCPKCLKTLTGRALTAWYHQNGNYHLINVRVYSDGMVDAWGLTSFDDFVKKMKQKIVVTRVPRGAKISCFPVFQGIVGADFTNYVLEDEFLKEILDVMAQLRGRPTSWSKCSIAWKNWEAFRTYQAQQELKMAYFAVPTHVREFILGDTPTKDGPIINALKKVYREDEREPMMVSRRMTGG